MSLEAQNTLDKEKDSNNSLEELKAIWLDTNPSAKDVDIDPSSAKEALLLKAASEAFPGGIKLASSLSLEDNYLTWLIAKLELDIKILALDTGRLPEETFEVAARITSELGVEIEWYYPKAEDIENLVSLKGPLSFRETAENRQECCAIRKVGPLKRALQGVDCWVTGLRASQSNNRTNVNAVELDQANGGILKLSPLIEWNFEDIFNATKRNKIPYNRLYDGGYKSIGCAPCTRALRPGESERAGRWWWETEGKKECGLHVVDGKLQRIN